MKDTLGFNLAAMGHIQVCHDADSIPQLINLEFIFTIYSKQLFHFIVCKDLCIIYVYRQCIGIPMGTNCAVYSANFYLFIYEFDFIKHLLKSNACPVVLHRLSLVCRFVDDLFVPDFPDFVNFIYLNQDSFGSGIYPKTSCELNCMSKGCSCNFLDLALRQSPQGLSFDIFDKRSQPEYAGIEMIRMPHVHSNISMTVKLGVINSDFYRHLRLFVVVRSFLSSRWSALLLLQAKGYLLKVLLKRTRGFLIKENFLFGISAFGIFRMILLRVL